MTKFTRRNEIVCSGTFTAVDGSTAQPSAAEAVLVYTSMSGAKATVVVPLTVGAAAVWSGVWDSSNAAPGLVEWMIHCWGGLVAATEGSFYIEANRANLSS